MAERAEPQASVGSPNGVAARTSSVAVVIPCYKYGHLLQECLHSVLDDQPGVDVRALVIDDCSPDDSAEQARRLAERDPRITVRVHTVNRGHIATYNEGLLEWADADYVALLSADDLLTPGALSRAAALMDAHPEVGFVYGHPIHWDPSNPRPAARTTLRGWSVWDGRWWLERRFREGTGNITSPEVVVRTSLQREVGGYRSDLPHTGDIEMWMRLAARADVGYLRGVDQAYYRIHGANMSRTTYDAPIVDLQQRLAAYRAVLDTYPQLPDHDRLDATIRSTLAKEAVYRASRAYDRGRTSQVPVDDLVAFAREVWPGVTDSLTFRGLGLRRRIGAAAMPYLQPLVWSALVRKARTWLWWQSWRRRGI